MIAFRPILIPFVLAAAASAATLHVGPGEDYTSIQAALDAAAPGDVIEVAPGLYPETLVVNTAPLSLAGPRVGDDARGRVTGVPDSAVEAVIAPAAGKAIEIATGAGPVSISGFAISAAATAGTGVISADTAPLGGLVLANNHIEVAAGAAGAAVLLNRDALDATMTGNVFLASAGSTAAVRLETGSTFHGLLFANNHVLRDGAAAHHGLHVDGNRNLGASPLRATTISGNLFRGHAVGLYGGARALAGAAITNNTFHENDEGMAAGPVDCLINGNEWSSNTSRGLRLTSLGETSDPAFGAAENTIENNHFEANGCDLACDDQAAGTLDGQTIRRNRFLSPVALSNQDPDVVLPVAYNYWGAADGPGGQAAGSGGGLTGAGSFVHEPFYTDFAMTSLDYGSSVLTGETIVGAGESITGAELNLSSGAVLRIGEGGRLAVDLLVMPAGTSVIVRRGEAFVGKIEMAAGAVLDVVDGDLSLDPTGDGSYHTIAGSFTFFNCLGSLWINGNTSFAGATLGLASDIHVLPGSTMLVTGSLTLDGCRLESSGTFSLLVNSGATLKMSRCGVKGAAVSLVGSDVTLRNNIFNASSVTCFSTVNGAAIYHNVFNGGLGLLNILPGAAVTTSVEGWGNVASGSAVVNELRLNFRPPGDPTRTLDADGNLYVQPGDALDVGLDVGKLNTRTQAVEALLGFSTDYLSFDALLPSNDWSNGLYESADETETVGLFDTAVGLGFAMPDPNGTTTAGPVADIRMLAQTMEGRTRVFFRTKNAGDNPFIDTRLTVSSGGVPSYKEYPFTSNTPTLTVDGTEPVFTPGATATQVQQAVPVDVLAVGVLTRIGTVTFTFDVRDDLAGIDHSDVSAELSGSAGTIAGTVAGSSQVIVDDLAYTRWSFTFAITATTPDGIYDVNAIVMDRSGNTGILAAGAIEVAKNRIVVTVEPQGLVSSSLTRDVEFNATDAGGAVLATWTVAVGFTGGSGTVVLDRVPDGTARLSARTAWNLRVREPVTLDSQGMGSASFTGTRKLPGGDFTGDNIINLADYNLMRVIFPGVATAPDITGDGFVNLADYNILRSNWLTAGEPK
jgi:hypothetical protein